MVTRVSTGKGGHEETHSSRRSKAKNLMSPQKKLPKVEAVAAAARDIADAMSSTIKKADVTEIEGPGVTLMIRTADHMLMTIDMIAGEDVAEI